MRAWGREGAAPAAPAAQHCSLCVARVPVHLISLRGECVARGELYLYVWRVRGECASASSIVCGECVACGTCVASAWRVCMRILYPLAIYLSCDRTACLSTCMHPSIQVGARYRTGIKIAIVGRIKCIPVGRNQFATGDGI